MRAFAAANPGENSHEKSGSNGAHKRNVPHIDRIIHAVYTGLRRFREIRRISSNGLALQKYGCS